MVLVLVLVGVQYCSRAFPSAPSGRTTHCSNTAEEPADRTWVNHPVKDSGGRLAPGPSHHGSPVRVQLSCCISRST